ncbi:MAG: hypothetical protein M1820_003288 [Bogoriella megaspora]|nr:MAG: hypothetical protein M1820_003288 [Bogoriella megaspora]
MKRRPADNSIIIRSVQLSDLEDMILLAPRTMLDGFICGNRLWRSPESWARALQDIASDVYSFGVVAVYVMLQHMSFYVSDEDPVADDAWRHILRRHISYFGDEHGFRGLLKHIGEENVFFERLIALAADFDLERPREPFAHWLLVDPEFRDLITKMMNLNPAKRISAREALEHPWFRQSEPEELELAFNSISRAMCHQHLHTSGGFWTSERPYKVHSGSTGSFPEEKGEEGA